MVIEYPENAGTHDICRLPLALPLVPHVEIVAVLGWLEKLATTPPCSGYSGTPGALGSREVYGHPAPDQFLVRRLDGTMTSKDGTEGLMRGRSTDNSTST